MAVGECEATAGCPRGELQLTCSRAPLGHIAVKQSVVPGVHECFGPLPGKGF